MGRKGDWQNQQNTGSRATLSRGRGVLSISDNPEAVLTAIKPALLLKKNLIAILAADWTIKSTSDAACSLPEGWC